MSRFEVIPSALQGEVGTIEGLRTQLAGAYQGFSAAGSSAGAAGFPDAIGAIESLASNWSRATNEMAEAYHELAEATAAAAEGYLTADQRSMLTGGGPQLQPIGQLTPGP